MVPMLLTLTIENLLEGGGGGGWGGGGGVGALVIRVAIWKMSNGAMAMVRHFIPWL